ncbi:MAG: AAA family ATPase [Deltaproteobacteria bacterium]|nr:AAA family ATPase [Deltaproteobacteria bacterium]
MDEKIPNPDKSRTDDPLPPLPLTHGYFPDLRSDGCVYVDKTDIIRHLLTDHAHKAIFLSRPRRFGKTLLISTIESILQGREDLFQGLDICNPNPRFIWKKSHVIRLNFAESSQSGKGFDESLVADLRTTAKRLGVSLSSATSKDAVRELIDVLYDSYGDIQLRSNGKPVVINGDVVYADHDKVSVLIDESDFPLLANYNNPRKLESVQSTLSEFYTALKTARDKGLLEFIIVTGITRFKELLADSGMNILYDITFESPYAQICGFSVDEINSTLKKYLEEAFDVRKSNPGMKSYSSADELFIDLKEWYDGYSWDGVMEVLNPYSVLNFLSEKRFTRYWYRTGAPGFLRQLDIRNIDYFKIYAKNTVSEDVVSDEDIVKISAPTALLMTGYLSVSKIDDSRDVEGIINYHLTIPNKEVKISFAEDHLIDRLYPGASSSKREAASIIGLYEKFGASMSVLDVDSASSIFSSILSGFPWEHIKTEERFFQHELSRALKFVDGELLEEPSTGDGRADFSIKLRTNPVLVMEVKYNKTKGLIEEQTKGLESNHQDNGTADTVKGRPADAVDVTMDPPITPISHKPLPDDGKPSEPDSSKKAGSSQENIQVKKCHARGIQSAFNQIYNKKYAVKYLWQDFKVYAVAISIVDRTSVRIDFREVTDGDWCRVPRPSPLSPAIGSDGSGSS